MQAFLHFLRDEPYSFSFWGCISEASFLLRLEANDAPLGISSVVAALRPLEIEIFFKSHTPRNISPGSHSNRKIKLFFTIP